MEEEEEEAVPLLLLPVHVCKVCFSPPTATEPSAASSSSALRTPPRSVVGNAFLPSRSLAQLVITYDSEAAMVGYLLGK